MEQINQVWKLLPKISDDLDADMIFSEACRRRRCRLVCCRHRRLPLLPPGSRLRIGRGRRAAPHGNNQGAIFLKGTEKKET